jgi:Heavy metal associated domain 2
MLPQAHIAHHGYGRTRLRIPSKRRDVLFFSRCERVLAQVPGIKGVQSNPLTGSLLVSHHTEMKRFAAEAAERELFEIPSGETLPEQLGNALSRFDQNLKEASGGNVDLKAAAFLTLIGLGIVQLVRGNPLPAAGSLFIDAIGLLIIL